MKTPDILPPAGALTNARADAKEFASYTLAEGTHDAYRRAYAAYRERCDQLGVSPLPCPVKGLVAAIRALAKEGKSASRLGVILAAVGMAHRLHSPRTLSRLRSRNWRNPSAYLMMPNTGSGVSFRRA